MIENSLSRATSGFVRVTGVGLMLLPCLASAHPGHYHHPDEVDEFDAFTAGALHPLTGLDHLLIALAVGWLAYLLTRGKPGLAVGGFCVSLIGGALFGRGAEGGHVLEAFLAATLLAAGAAFLLSTAKTRALAFLVPVMVAGALHGIAHGAEGLGGDVFGMYLAGVAACSAVICSAGIGMGLVSKRMEFPLGRLAGLGLLAAGVIGMVGAF